MARFKLRRLPNSQFSNQKQGHVIGNSLNVQNIIETMETNLKHFEELISELPKNSIKVAESGISSSEDIKYINDLGYDAVLVGTSLMGSNNPGKALEELIGGVL